MRRKAAQFSLILLLVTTLSCSDNDSTPNYFMACEIDGAKWDSGNDHGLVDLDYNDTAQEHFFTVWSKNFFTADDERQYQISITVNCPISKGTYYFNNDGLTMDAIGGVAATITGYDKYFSSASNFSGHSLNGFVEVTGLTKKNIQGKFEFTAAIQKSSDPLDKDTIQIEKGVFFVPIGIIYGKDWEGPN